MKRVSKSEELRQGLAKILTEGTSEEGRLLDVFLKQAARLMIQESVEGEVDEYLGRMRYERGERKRVGHRNGYEPGNLKTTAGILQVAVPQVRGSEEPYQSALMGRLKHGSDKLLRMVLKLYVGGLSQRDIEHAYEDVFGRRVVSRGAVSKGTELLWHEYEEWRVRDLSNLDLEYLFLDGHYVKMRQGAAVKEAILVAYGILRSGKKVLIHMALGMKESYSCWLALGRDMLERGLRMPVLIVSDGNQGLERMLGECFPGVAHQRCHFHKMQNILAKVPKHALELLKKQVQDVLHAETYEAGMKQGKELIALYANEYPSAMNCLEKDLHECVVYLKFPQEHWRSIRTANAIERLFGENRRRMKVIPGFPTEKSGLKLIYATLISASSRWHGLRVSMDAVILLEKIRLEQDAERQKIIEQARGKELPEPELVPASR